MDTVFGGFTLILVGDIAQLPPVLDKPLYCLASEDPLAMMGRFDFRKIDYVVKLKQNVRVSLADDNKNLGNYYYGCVMVNQQLQISRSHSRKFQFKAYF